MVELDDLIENKDKQKKAFQKTIVFNQEIQTLIEESDALVGRQNTTEAIRRFIKNGLPEVIAKAKARRKAS